MIEFPTGYYHFDQVEVHVKCVDGKFYYFSRIHQKWQRSPCDAEWYRQHKNAGVLKRVKDDKTDEFLEMVDVPRINHRDLVRM